MVAVILFSYMIYKTHEKSFFLLFSGERDQDSHSLIDYFKGQFSILNDVSSLCMFVFFLSMHS